jgi:dipeptidyl aminopeptidase/acylaminoacyl peptidase
MKNLLLSLLLIPSLSYSDPYPLDYWAVRNGVSSVQISPEGSYISYLFIGSKYSNPVVHIKKADDLSGEPQVIGADKMEITYYSWVDDSRMVVNFRQKTRENIKGFNDGIYDYKSALLDVKKNKFTELEKFKSGSGQNSVISIVNSLPFDKNNVLVGYADNAGKSGGSIYSYYKFNLNSFKKTLVLRGNSEYYNIRFSNKGKPISANSYDASSGDYIWHYRDYEGETKGKKWIEFYRLNKNSFEDFQVLGAELNEDGEWLNVAYVAAQNGRDKQGLWRYDLKSKKFLELIFEHPKVDVYSGITSYDPEEMRRNFVGVTTFSNKLKRYYFNLKGAEELEAFYSQLEQIIPNAYQVSISDRTNDDKIKIIKNEGPKDPGSYYLLKDNTIEFLVSVKPFLEAENLADLKYIRYPSSDGAEIAAYVHIPKGKGPFPLIVTPHGGPFVGETMNFEPISQVFANNGYMVVQPQYRGSFNYGMKHHMDAFINGGQGGKLMQDDKDYAAKYLVEAGLADPDNLFMWGWSYGGYAALLAANNDLYKCSIGVAVVSDMKQQLSYYANQMGTGAANFRQKQYRIGSISPIDVVDQVKIPLLVIHGDKDQRTPIKHAYKYVDGLKKYNKDHKFVVLEGADHFYNSLNFDNFMTVYNESLNFMETCGS